MQEQMTTQAKQRLIRVALGQEKADLVLKNAQYLNVFTESWAQGDIAIADGRIAGIGSYDGETERDMSGLRVVPGFIDGHMHFESSLVMPSRFAEAVVPHGTTSVVCDPHELANIMGVGGIRYMLEATEGLPIDAYVMLPSCVPATDEDESYTALFAKDLEPLWNHSRVLGLAEMMNYPGVLAADAAVCEKITETQKRSKPVDGHAPCLSGKELTAYIAAGIHSDHECSTFEEGLEKLAQGQWVMIRQGTAAQNLEALLPLLKAPYASRCLFVTDDKHPSELINDGHIDDIVRMAIEWGVSPITALKTATWNPAAAFGFSKHGAIAPSYVADLAVLDDAYQVQMTIKDGKLVYDGQPIAVNPPEMSDELVELALHSFRMPPIDERVFSREGSLGVIGMVDGQIITTDGGLAQGIDISNDILKIASLERHHHTGHVGVGYIRGYGLKCGAVASSVAHDSHNIIVVGTNDRDMACAAERIRVLGGGLVIAKDQVIVNELPLPIAGVMTDKNVQDTNDLMESLKTDAALMGVHDGIDPFMTLSFMSLPVIPTMRVLTHGMFNASSWSYVSR